MTLAARVPLNSRAAGIALVTGLHMAVLALLLADMAPSALPAGPARTFLLVSLVPPRAAAIPHEQPPVRPVRPVRPQPVAHRRSAALKPPPVHADADSTPAPSAPSEAPFPDPFATPAPAPSLAERARGSAGKIARELAQEAGQPSVPGMLAARRGQAFDRAWQGGSHGFTEERTVSPDGTSVIRRTKRGSVSCHMPEPYQLRAIPRSSAAEQRVNCPPDDGRWERH